MPRYDSFDVQLRLEFDGDMIKSDNIKYRCDMI